jgi:DNA-binding MltR family transcriptional regulator
LHEILDFWIPRRSEPEFALIVETPVSGAELVGRESTLSDRGLNNMSEERPYGVVPTDRDREMALEALLSAAMTDASTVMLNASDFDDYYIGLLTESDRASGILAFTFIETQVSELFAQQLDPTVSGGIPSIIGRNGILDSVGARLTMLRALRWLTEETYRDLRLLANIRNRFAHSHVALTFNDQTIRGYLSSLQTHEIKFATEHPSVTLSIKHVFLVRTVMTLFGLFAELVLMPSSLRAGLGPTGAFRAGVSRFPRPLQDALARCTMTVRLIYENAETQAAATADTSAVEGIGTPAEQQPDSL